MKIKAWKYNDMMNKVCKYGDLWMDMDSFKRNDDIASEVIVDENGYVTFIGKIEIEKETAKAFKVRFDGVWSEWMPKSAVVM